MPRTSRPSAKRRTSRLLPAALLAAALGAACAAAVLLMPGAAAPAAAASRPPDEAAIRSLAFRTMLASGVATDPASGEDGAATAAGLATWTGALARGDLALSDLLLRCFTGTAWLLEGEDDAAFAAAVHEAVLDRPPTPAEAADDAAALAGGDRLSWLASFLARDDVRALCDALGLAPGAIPAEALARALAGGGSAAALAAAVDAPLPEAGGYAFGALASRGTVAFGGLAGRVDVLVDRRVASQSFVDASDAASDGAVAFDLTWDADREAPGPHRTVVLARRADGRGLLVDGGDYVVPAIRDLPEGVPVPGAFATGGTDDVYRIAAAGGAASFRAFLPTSGVGLAVFARAGEPLDASFSAGADFAEARFRTEGARTVYVRATRAGTTAPDGGAPAAAEDAPAYMAVLDADAAVAATWTGSATLRAAPGSASDAVGSLPSGTLAALLGEGTDPDGDLWYHVRTADLEGYLYSESAHPIRIPARLASLSVARSGTSSPLALWPAFDPEATAYGLVLDADVDAVALAFAAREAGDADVAVDWVDADGASLAVDDVAAIPVPPGGGVLRLRIASADRSTVREVAIHVLRPPAADGFSATLDAFPASYRSALWLLHAAHPAWTFEAFATGIAFPDFLAAEGQRDRCLLPEGQVPASFLEPGSPVYDGTVWKAASDAAIARFADPRAFLTERDVFQFERLAYVPGVASAEGVAAILDGSFFLEPTTDADGTALDFVRLFLEAGRESGTSPYFLASRSLQEMGRNGTALAFGTVTGHEGFFNYYNIGALPDPSVPDADAINGALFAQYGASHVPHEPTDDEKAILLPWTTRSLAVRGGAIHIASRYIAVGQDTQYLQKFDLVPDSGLYTHQYMQNLLAPRNESRRAYRAYRRTGLLGTPFAFRIPVFLAMPDEPAPEPPSGS